MNVEVTAGSKSVVSPEDVFERQAMLAGSVTVLVAVFAACIGFYKYLVEPAFIKYTQSVELANGVFVYGGVVLIIGVIVMAYAVSVVVLCDNDED
jgi:uncharacterized membrane protein